jgi:hypothetical protein
LSVILILYSDAAKGVPLETLAVISLTR